jgi:hypothetical protein
MISILKLRGTVIIQVTQKMKIFQIAMTQNTMMRMCRTTKSECLLHQALWSLTTLLVEEASIN